MDFSDIIYDEFAICDHDSVDYSGICMLCGEIVQVATENETKDMYKKAKSKSTAKYETSKKLQIILDRLAITNEFGDTELMNVISEQLRGNKIQISNDLIAKKIIFAAIYSHIYINDMVITTERLYKILDMGRKDACDAMKYIKNDRVEGPSLVIISPNTYLMEYRKLFPDDAISEYITDELIEKVTNINWMMYDISKYRPSRIAIWIIQTFVERDFENRRVQKSLMRQIYSIYQIKDAPMINEIDTVKKLLG